MQKTQFHSKPLTERQALVVYFIREARKELGRSPSLSEIANFMGYKHAANARSVVLGAVAKGYLKRVKGRKYVTTPKAWEI